MKRLINVATLCTNMLAAFVLAGLLGNVLNAQVPSNRLREAASEPENWLMYSGDYFSNRYSPLDQITPSNVDDLALQWVYQTPISGPWQVTPLVVDGVM